MTKEKIKSKERIKKEVHLPEGVNATINNQFLTLKGHQGEVSKELKQNIISIKMENGKVLLESKGQTKEDKKIMGSLVAHIKNMIRGCSQNHMYTLKICSGHFPMNVSVSGNKLIVKNFLGEKVPRVLQLKQGAEVKIESDVIYVSSTSKETAGQVSADIEQLIRRPGYDPRIFQDGIYITNKDGKQLK